MRKILYSLVVLGVFFLSSSVMAASGDLCGKIGGKCLGMLKTDSLYGSYLSGEDTDKGFSRCIQEYKNLECSMEKLKDVYELAEMIYDTDWDIVREINKVHGNTFEGKELAKVISINYRLNVFPPYRARLSLDRCRMFSTFDDFKKLCDIVKEKKIDNVDILLKIEDIKDMKVLLQSNEY
nr:MAG TPA: hypothetical protein [Bacteriophage sp.]